MSLFVFFKWNSWLLRRIPQPGTGLSVSKLAQVSVKAEKSMSTLQLIAERTDTLKTAGFCRLWRAASSRKFRKNYRETQTKINQFWHEWVNPWTLKHVLMYYNEKISALTLWRTQLYVSIIIYLLFMISFYESKNVMCSVLNLAIGFKISCLYF